MLRIEAKRDANAASSIRRSGYHYDDVCTLEHVYSAFNQVRKSSHYKAPVKSFYWNQMRYSYLMWRDLQGRKYKPEPVFEFDQKERGKTRHIRANSTNDRVLNTVLQNNLLSPLTENILIDDNAASRLNYGVDFTRNRLEKHLHDAFVNYGPNAYICALDMSNFFGSICLDLLLAKYRQIIEDDDCYNLLELMIRSHNDGDFGMGIGSIISQNAGLFYPHRLDFFVKTVKGTKYYARYMDDMYFILPDEEQAKKLMVEVSDYARDELLLTINHKKDQMCTLRDRFTFLKITYWMSETGRLFKRQSGDTFKRERKKLKKFKNTKMLEEDILISYLSWRGNVVRSRLNMPRVLRTDLVFMRQYPQLIGGLLEATKLRVVDESGRPVKNANLIAENLENMRVANSGTSLVILHYNIEP